MKLNAFLRWAGGKVHGINRMLPFIPEDYNKGTYWEPFLGGASMFFALSPSRAVLSDLNSHLMNCYKMVCDYPEEVYNHLNKFRTSDSELTYY